MYNMQAFFQKSLYIVFSYYIKIYKKGDDIGLTIFLIFFLFHSFHHILYISSYSLLFYAFFLFIMCVFMHFIHFFKKYVGMSCIEYINNVRLEQAALQLESNTDTTLDVSLAVGFRNLSYFHRAFKKKYGMTPGKFVQENNAGFR